MLSLKVEHLKVSDLRISEKYSVVAKMRSGLVSGDEHIKSRIRYILKLKGDLFETLAGKGRLWSRL